MEINRLSYSMVRCYLDCPRSFYFRYIRRLPAVLDGRVLAGRVYHHGVEYALKRKKEGQVVYTEEVRDIMSDHWGVEVGEHAVYNGADEKKVEAIRVNWANDEPGKLKDAVLQLGGVYIRDMLPKIQPLAVEERIITEIADISFVAVPDVVVAGPGVIDHKLATRRANQEFIDRDLQFSAYAAAIGKPIWASWHQALDQKKPSINVVMTERDRNDIDLFGQVVAGVWSGIQSGVFPPNPLSWKCYETKCAHWMECRVLMEI